MKLTWKDTDVESAIVTKKCPIISKTFFCGSYDINFVNRHTDSTKWMMNYITEKTPFDSGLIWKYLIRTQNMADIKKNMQLNYVVSSKIPHAEEGHMKIALVLHIYFSDLALYCRKYAESMPEGTDVYITVPDKQKLEEVKRPLRISLTIQNIGLQEIVEEMLRLLSWAAKML